MCAQRTNLESLWSYNSRLVNEYETKYMQDQGPSNINLNLLTISLLAMD